MLRATYPTTHRMGQPPSSQSILSSTSVRRLIPETQAKPFMTDRRWLSLVNSSNTISPLADGLLNPLISSNIKVPELPQYDTVGGNHINNFKKKLPLYQDERLYWKLFPGTFQGEDIDWNTKLPPKCVNS